MPATSTISCTSPRMHMHDYTLQHTITGTNSCTYVHYKSLLLFGWAFTRQFSVPQIEYPLGGSSKKGSHVYFLLQVFWVILLFCQLVLLFDINVVLTSQ